MKLTTILHSIILCLAIENGKYYTLANKNGAETQKVGPDGKPIVVVPETSKAGPQGSAETSKAGPQGSAETSKAGPQGSAEPSKAGPQGSAETSKAGPQGSAEPSKAGPQGSAEPSKAGPQGSAEPSKAGPQGSAETSKEGPQGSAKDPVVPKGPTGESKLKGDKDEKIVKDGCNFYDKLDLGIKPFGEIKGDKTVCSVVLNQEFDAFLYACDGTSEPPKCPSEVKTEDGVVKIETLFSKATVTDQSDKYPSKPNVFHVITGKANKQFSASCVCSKKDGTKETMELTSSFKQAGILGILGFLVVYLMN